MENKLWCKSGIIYASMQDVGNVSLTLFFFCCLAYRHTTIFSCSDLIRKYNVPPSIYTQSYIMCMGVYVIFINN